MAAVRISGWDGARARGAPAAPAAAAPAAAAPATAPEGGGGAPPDMSAAIVAPWYWLREETGAARLCLARLG